MGRGRSRAIDAIDGGGLLAEHAHHRVRESVDGNLSTPPGKALTISPGQLLAATNGVTPVASASPRTAASHTALMGQ